VIVAIAPDSELKLLSVSTPARGHHLMMSQRVDYEHQCSLQTYAVTVTVTVRLVLEAEYFSTVL